MAVIDSGVAAHLESGSCSMVVATVDEVGLPHAARAWSVQVLPDGERLRVLLAADETVAIANLRSTAVVALTAAAVTTLVAFQIKGRAISVEPADDDDRRRFERYRDEFVQAVHEVDGADVETIARMAPSDVVAVVATIDAVFDQTPGPEAGARLRSEAT